MKPARKRQLVEHARATWRVSIRRACRALPIDRSTYHYRSRRAGQAQLTERIKEMAATRVRYGYVNLRAAEYPEEVRIKQGLEALWQRYQKYSDANFREEFARRPDDRFWEMY